MAITRDVLASVAEQGFGVVDGFLDAARARELLDEMRAASPHFRPHKWQFGGAVLPKPGISELDLHDKQSVDLAPSFHRFWREELPPVVRGLCDGLADVGSFPHTVDPEPIDRCVSVKLQRNAGQGAMFPMHHDNPGPPSKRVLTLVVYLNAGWTEGDGGEIVLAPFASQRTCVAPRFNRAVIFRSDLLLHHVEPAHAERFCFTVWIDADGVNSAEACNLTTRHLVAGPYHDGSAHGIAAFLRQTPLNRSVMRAVYADELAQQLRLCLSAAGGVPDAHISAVLAAHTRAVEAQCAHPQLGPVVLELRRVAAETESEAAMTRV